MLYVITQLHQHTAVHIHILVTHTTCRHTTASTHCSTHTHSCYTCLMSSHNCINTLQYTYIYLSHTQRFYKSLPTCTFFLSFLLGGEGSATANFQKPPFFFFSFLFVPEKKKCLVEMRMLNLLIFSEIQLTWQEEENSLFENPDGAGPGWAHQRIKDQDARPANTPQKSPMPITNLHGWQRTIANQKETPLLHFLIPPHFVHLHLIPNQLFLSCL